jgi:hypothetical protein
MPSSGMLRRATLVKTDVSQELGAATRPHGVTSQKPAFFIVTAVETLNLT